MNMHESLTLTPTTSPWERLAGYNWYAECSCHNPDAEGVGRADVLAASVEDVYAWHDDHKTLFTR